MDGRLAALRATVAAQGVRDVRVLDAIGTVPRERFVPDDQRALAFEDRPLPIGGGQTISQPTIVAMTVEALALPVDGTARVLEVGAGSGYAAAVLARLAARVWAVERLPALAEAATRRLAELGIGNVTVVCADGSLGWPAEAPFDGIAVAAAAPEVPAALKDQLAIGGRLVVPVGDEVQWLRVVHRTAADRWEEHDLTAVRFVPLLGAQGFPGP